MVTGLYYNKENKDWFALSTEPEWRGDVRSEVQRVFALQNSNRTSIHSWWTPTAPLALLKWSE